MPDFDRSMPMSINFGRCRPGRAQVRPKLPWTRPSEGRRRHNFRFKKMTVCRIGTRWMKETTKPPTKGQAVWKNLMPKMSWRRSPKGWEERLVCESSDPSRAATAPRKIPERARARKQRTRRVITMIAAVRGIGRETRNAHGCGLVRPSLFVRSKGQGSGDGPE